MFRIGAPRTLWQPSFIDHLTDRQPGERTQNSQAGILALLEQGANLTEISPVNRQRFLDEGLEYLVEYNTDHPFLRDTPQLFFAVWTP
jgi:hypothetical protein